MKESFDEVAYFCERHLEATRGREIGMTFGAAAGGDPLAKQAILPTAHVHPFAAAVVLGRRMDEKQTLVRFLDVGAWSFARTLLVDFDQFLAIELRLETEKTQSKTTLSLKGAVTRGVVAAQFREQRDNMADEIGYAARAAVAPTFRSTFHGPRRIGTLRPPRSFHSELMVTLDCPPGHRRSYSTKRADPPRLFQRIANKCRKSIHEQSSDLHHPQILLRRKKT